jgi:antitoxin component YwqK of YwqJK toxin-antitoxin module
MGSRENIAKLDQLKQLYPSSDGYVFKSCSIEWIVILQKLEDTKNNELRDDVKDSMHAKFRANKLLVIDIVNKFNNQTIDKTTNSFYAKKIIAYKKGEIIEVLNFDEDLNEVRAPGIHYFKSPTAAFYYELGNKRNGLYKEWYETGQLYEEYTRIDGKRNGLYKVWYENGQLKEECSFKNGLVDSLWKVWYENGQLEIERTCKDGKLNGQYRMWYKNGQPKMECLGKDGIRNGSYKDWYENGQPDIEYTYKGGKMDGLYKKWYENGQLKEECTYIDGKKNGLYKEWKKDGQLFKEYIYKDKISCCC